MKTYLWLLLAWMPFCAVAQDNIGFERGTFEGWTLSYGKVYENGTVTLFGDETLGTLDEGHKITSSTDGRDPIVGIPMVAPGSKYSARIGNTYTNAYFDKISTSFVATQDKSLFQYKFAVVLQDPGHSHIEQPAFSILVEIEGEKAPCGFYEVAAGRGIPGFKESYGVIYRNWTTGSIDLRNYVGKKITISIRTQDCTPGGHWGYGYFDAELIKAEIKTGVYCQEDSSIILNAPDGFAAYEWFNGDISRQIKAKVTKNEKVFVKVRPFSSLNEDCELRFDFNPGTDIQTVSQSFSACEGDVLKVAGQTINAKKNETIYVRIPRAGYCDSIVTVNLKVTPKAVLNQKISICEGDLVKVGGRIYSQSGFYSDIIKRLGQCDSIVNTTLTVISLVRYSAKISICEGDKFILGDTIVRHPGTYTRRMARPNLCDSIATVDITVIPLPRMSINRSICRGDSMIVGGTTLKTAGNHTIRIQRRVGCDSIVTVAITIFDEIPNSQLTLKTNYTLTLGDSIELKGELNLKGEFSYDWYPTTGILGCSICPNAVVKPLNNTIYSIIYNKGTSCERVIPIEVSVKLCPMFFPDVFTPNDDQINDGFKVFCNCLERIEQFTVFNRWGEAIHTIRETPSESNLWDGFILNEVVADGVYVFVIDYRYINGKIERKRGSFYVKR